MKAEITERGELIITPENGTESFALMAWNAGYNEKYATTHLKPTLIISMINDKNHPAGSK
jgi:hypothetical protein